MSRIGKKPIPIPSGVHVDVAGDTVHITGPKGAFARRIHPDIRISVTDGFLVLDQRRETPKSSALWGLWRSLVANMVAGAAVGFEKKLELEGIGYRVAVEGANLSLQLGFSHPVRFPIPEGITMRAEKNIITISGCDKAKVGQVASSIRSLKKPEPYKGKGIRYQGEIIRRKAGKKAVASA